MKVTDKEIASVSLLTPFERYKYFIKRVADSELMYTLIDSNREWAIADVEGKGVLSVWSAPEFAEQNAIEQWSGFSVEEVSIERFEEDVIDKIEENGYLVNVFPVKGKSGFVVELIEFARDLNEEMRKYH